MALVKLPSSFLPNTECNDKKNQQYKNRLGKNCAMVQIAKAININGIPTVQALYAISVSFAVDAKISEHLRNRSVAV